MGIKLFLNLAYTYNIYVVIAGTNIPRLAIGTQAVLVAHHHQLVVGVLGNEGEIAEHALGEYQLLEAVNLFVL